MTGLLDKLVGAFATAEGFFAEGDTLPKRNHNPGNLRAAPWGMWGKDAKGFVVFESDAEGIAGLYHQLALDIARGHSLASLIAKYAPPSENNTQNYVSETARRVGVNPNVPLWDYLDVMEID